MNRLLAATCCAALAALVALVALPAAALAALPLDLGTLPTLRFTGPAGASADVGSALAGDCDLDDDGRPDLIVGARSYNPAAAPLAPGGAFIVFGGRGRLTGELALLGDVGKAQHAPQTGTAVACAGDVNGDGIDDALIGAPDFAPVGAAQGRLGAVYVVFGATDLDDQTTLRLGNLGARGFAIVGAPGTTAGGRLGNVVAGLGDLDGDTRAEIGTAAWQMPNGATSSAGVAYVVAGRAATTPVDLAVPGAALLQAGGAAATEQLEDIVAVGDLTGDDVPELAVGARNHDSLGRTNNGAAFVLDGAAARGALTLGPAPTYPAAVLWTVHGAAGGDLAGINVAAPGDVNGDDVPDLLVGTNLGSAGAAGAAAVVFGAPTGDVDLGALGDRGYAIRAPADQNGAVRFGAIGGAGDVDGDGRADLLLGQTGPRQVTLLYGKGTTTEQSLGALDAANGEMGARLITPSAAIGSVIATLGDVDGNGTADLGVGGGSGATGFADALLLPAPAPDPGPGTGGEVDVTVDWGIRANLRSYVYNSTLQPGYVVGAGPAPIAAQDGAVCFPNPDAAIGGCDPRRKTGADYPSAFRWTPTGAELDVAGDRAVVATRGRIVLSYPAHCFTITVVDPRWTLAGSEATVSVRLIQDVVEGCSAVGAPGEVAGSDSDQRVTLASFRIAARTVRAASVTWVTETGSLTEEGAKVLTLLTPGSELDPATITVPRSIGGLPELDPKPAPAGGGGGGTTTVTVPGPAVVRTVTTPATRTTSAKRLTGVVRGVKSGKRRVTVDLSRVLGSRPDRVYRVWVTQRGRSIAAGTLEGTELTLTVAGRRTATGKGRQRRVRTTYPRLKGSFTLRPASGGTNLPTVLMRLG